jgi:hypothetical protein
MKVVSHLRKQNLSKEFLPASELLFSFFPGSPSKIAFLTIDDKIYPINLFFA